MSLEDGETRRGYKQHMQKVDTGQAPEGSNNGESDTQVVGRDSRTTNVDVAGTYRVYNGTNTAGMQQISHGAGSNSNVVQNASATEQAGEGAVPYAAALVEATAQGYIYLPAQRYGNLVAFVMTGALNNVLASSNSCSWLVQTTYHRVCMPLMPASAASFRYLASNYLPDQQEDNNHLMQQNYHSISMPLPNNVLDHYFRIEVPAVTTGAAAAGYCYSSADASALPNNGGPSAAAPGDGGCRGSNKNDTTRTSPPHQLPPFTIPSGFQAPQLQQSNNNVMSANFTSMGNHQELQLATPGRPLGNAMYGSENQMQGLEPDPHLRMFDLYMERKEKQLHAKNNLPNRNN